MKPISLDDLDFSEAQNEARPNWPGEQNTCCACGKSLGFVPLQMMADACGECRRKYPHSLLKAALDYFDYALKLRTGEIIRFRQCAFRGEFVSLDISDSSDCYGQVQELPFTFDRGIEVRISDIVWCADAPNGS